MTFLGPAQVQLQVEIRPAPGRKRPHEDVEVVEVRWPSPVLSGMGKATCGELDVFAEPEGFSR